MYVQDILKIAVFSSRLQFIVIFSSISRLLYLIYILALTLKIIALMKLSTLMVGPVHIQDVAEAFPVSEKKMQLFAKHRTMSNGQF